MPTPSMTAKRIAHPIAPFRIARGPPRTASAPPVKKPAMMAFQGSSFLRTPLTAQSKVENMPPQTPKLPPRTGARALIAVRAVMLLDGWRWIWMLVAKWRTSYPSFAIGTVSEAFDAVPDCSSYCLEYDLVAVLIDGTPSADILPYRMRLRNLIMRPMGRDLWCGRGHAVRPWRRSDTG